MTDLARLSNFVSGTPAVADEVDAELNQLVSGHNDQEDRLEILGAYRTLCEGFANYGSGGLAGTFFMGLEGMDVSGSEVVGSDRFIPLGLYLAAADYPVTGKSTKLRVRAQMYTNATAPGVNLTVGWYPISAVAGSANNIGYTFGPVVAGSTVAFNTQAANTLGQGNSGDFAFPADGHYVFGLVVSGTTAVSSVQHLRAQLQLRHV